VSWTEGRGQKRGSLDPVQLLDTGVVGQLTELLALGALVSFGMSRDGGSLSCTVTYEGEWDREWFRDCSELGAWLTEAVRAIDAQASARPPATGGSQRSANGAPRRSR